VPTPLRLSLDRFEGPGKEVAVLVDDEGVQVLMPRAYLPPGARPGVVLTLRLEVDEQATAELNREGKAIQDRLSSRDPGGDVSL